MKTVETLLTRLRRWWRTRNELGNLDRDELRRIAGELNMTANDLEEIVAHGPDAAALLQKRMQALGLSTEDVESAARGLMRDLERTCACCNEKGICEKDLTKQPDKPRWKGYCPNAISLDWLAKLKGLSQAGSRTADSSG